MSAPIATASRGSIRTSPTSKPRSQSSRRRPMRLATSTRCPRRGRPRSKRWRRRRARRMPNEAAHVTARAKLEASRGPLADADRRVQRLETEARTISKLVNGETKNLWPPIIDGVHVAKGYEKALGAALGDDLDAPVDPSAPMRWSQAGAAEGDPALPEGVEAARRPRRSTCRAAAPPAPDRRRQPRTGPGTGGAAEERPAAGVAGRRSLALGRLRRRGAMRRPARRGGLPSARASSTSRPSSRTRRSTPRRGGRSSRPPKPN